MDPDYGNAFISVNNARFEFYGQTRTKEFTYLTSSLEIGTNTIEVND